MIATFPVLSNRLDALQKNRDLMHMLLVVAVSLLLQVLVLAGDVGVNIPVLRPVTGFIYLALLPGLIILRILKFKDLGIIKTLFYGVGLSLTTVMLLGFLANLILPHTGIPDPLATQRLMNLTIPIFLVLGFVAYLRNRGSTQEFRLNWRLAVSLPALLLGLVPLLAILGAQLVNAYRDNIVLLVVLAVIAAMPLLVAFTRLVPQKYYPVALAAIGLALLFHISLISDYLNSFDIHTEYYFANLTLLNSWWNYTIPHNYNAMLSVSVLAPIFSRICALDLTWVFKIIYPAVFALVPLVIYHISRGVIGAKAAFMAAFFFMAVKVFYFDMTGTARQEIAYLLMTMIILLTVERNMKENARLTLTMIFGVALIFSHYSMGIILMGLLAGGYVLAVISRLMNGDPLKSAIKGYAVCNPLVAVIFIVSGVVWYVALGGGSVFSDALGILRGIVTNIGHLLNPDTSEALWIILTPTVSPLHDALKYLHLALQFFIGIGILDLLIHWNKKDFNDEYSILSLLFFTLLVLAVVLPYVAVTLLTTRLYHISLLLLSPFAYTGLRALWRLVSRNRGRVEVPVRALSIILAALLLFSTGFVFELAKNDPYSIALSQKSIGTYGTVDSKALFYNDYTPVQEVYSARWYSKYTPGNSYVYTNTWYGAEVHALRSYGMQDLEKMVYLTPDLKTLDKGQYIFLGYNNVVNRTISIRRYVGQSEDSDSVGRIQRDNVSIDEIEPLLAGSSRIYTNGASEIYIVAQPPPGEAH